MEIHQKNKIRRRKNLNMYTSIIIMEIHKCKKKRNSHPNKIEYLIKCSNKKMMAIITPMI